MDVLMLSRLQFATTAMFHFLFVPLTLGLVVIVAIMETIYVRTGNDDYRRMARFWGRLFVVNFAIGIVTGITLEFQFGTNWSKYSAYVGDIFGSLLAIEASLAFFLESTFIGVWIFGWKRLSPALHAMSIWIVAIASNTSAFWILCANAWMQNPVGFEIRNGRAELTDFMAVITQPTAVLAFFHTITAAFILGGFFVMAISAYHLLRKSHVAFFTKSFRIGMYFALVCSVLELGTGHMSGGDVAENQPAKLAAMESLWESETRAKAVLFLIPDPKNERNLFEIIKVPPILSVLAYGRADAEVKGLKDFPIEDRPPVSLTFWAFRTMVGLGALFPILAGLGWLWRNKLQSHPLYLHLMLYALVLPYIAIQCGWIVAEVGRQPWIVQGIMRTADAVSPIATSQVLVSFIAFILVYSVLGLTDFILLAKFAKRGPEPAAASATEGATHA